MKKKEITYLSADNHTTIYGILWIPDGEAKAVLQISHGVTEYIRRYEEFAEFMTAKGFVVAGNDHLGHGKSIGKAPMWLGEKGSWNYAVKDLLSVYDHTQSMYPDLPHAILGFSMGSFLVRQLLIDYPGKFHSAVIMGTGQTAPAAIKFASIIANLEAKKAGEDVTTPKIKALTFGTYNKRFAPNQTDFDWLCSNKEALEKYSCDPLIGGPMTSGLFREMLSGMAYTGKQKNIQKMEKSTPVFFLSGDNDPVGDCGKGVKKAYHSFQKAGIPCDLKMYSGMRHDILHETEYRKVYHDILLWLEEHLFLL